VSTLELEKQTERDRARKGEGSREILGRTRERERERERGGLVQVNNLSSPAFLSLSIGIPPFPGRFLFAPVRCVSHPASRGCVISSGTTRKNALANLSSLSYREVYGPDRPYRPPFLFQVASRKGAEGRERERERERVNRAGKKRINPRPARNELTERCIAPRRD